MTAYPLVLVEFASHGDLLGYLLKSRGLPDTYYQTTGKLTRVTAKKMMMFAWQIANGMNFLSQHKVTITGHYIQIQWKPDSPNPRFLATPDDLSQQLLPFPQSNIAIFTPDFSKQFSFPMVVREIWIPL